MSTSKAYLPVIATTLKALRPILADALQDVDHGIRAADKDNQNGAVGSIIPTEETLKQAIILLQAIRILHRQN